ncbi:GMC oxidoreductase [Ruegeria profundi]|uniref:GMC oxidoreductase n=1 Tax=Ruegeria profundi TaxID=1685378 RepID=UPI003C7D69A5
MFVSQNFFDSETLPPVIIVGSGPAGMTLGCSLLEKKIPCLILEAGDRDYESDIQDDYIGETSGDIYHSLDITRLRQFGGSSNHWSGWCRPLDAWDFDPVPSLGIPGWPIRKSDLDPYSAKANEILEIPSPIDQRVSDSIFESRFVRSPPVRFGEKYEGLVRTSKYLNVALRTAVTAMYAEDGRIVSLEFVDSSGSVRRISPKFVVLACGGIENSRLLLWSNFVSSQRVVAQPGSLGRYWMEHPHEVVGRVSLSRLIHQRQLPSDLFSVSVTADRLVKHGALNASIRLPYPRDLGLKQRIRKGFCELDPELLELVSSTFGTTARCTDQPLKAVWEQAPDFGNRVALSETSRDSFGKPRSHLIWRKTAQDYRTARVAFELVATHIVRTGAGVVWAAPHLIKLGEYPEDGEIGGHHHMGGTRMSNSAEHGVVDANLKIHGTSNGYVAGSSVFVRGGHANPTYTIVQLSLRLSDHLATKLSS